ncbi:hypothetical protein FBY24_3100 [Cellulomonas sp. SLBN-39]|nr:hypothetical protein FBY24_3100 [Cellulomonas sp. SLBN-39]
MVSTPSTHPPDSSEAFERLLEDRGRALDAAGDTDGAGGLSSVRGLIWYAKGHEGVISATRAYTFASHRAEAYEQEADLYAHAGDVAREQVARRAAAAIRDVMAEGLGG